MSNQEMIANFDKTDKTEIAIFYTTHGTIEVVNHIGICVEITATVNHEVIANDLHVDFPVWDYDFFELGNTLVDYYLN